MTLTAALAACGVPAGLPPGECAATLVRALPLAAAGAAAAAPEEALNRGWFTGPDECAGVLAAITGWARRRGGAFGGPWPMLSTETGLVAPALPVALAGGEVEGPDGVYRTDGTAVWREAAGRDEILLAGDAAAAPPSPRPELLWYGPGERYLVAAGGLVVSDLFSALAMPATAASLERLLVRGGRRDPAILAGLTTASDGPARLTVRRARALLAVDAPEPPALLAARADVRTAAARGDELSAELEDGRRVVFTVREETAGWRLERCAGAYPLAALAMRAEEAHIALTATLDDALDPLAAGVRSRVAFDLISDLIAVSRESARRR